MEAPRGRPTGGGIDPSSPSTLPCAPTQGAEGSPAAPGRSPPAAPLLLAPSPSSRSEFSFEAGAVCRVLGDPPPAPSPPLGRYRPLTNASSQEGLAGTPSPKSCPSSDSSPGFARRDAWLQRHSEGELLPPGPLPTSWCGGRRVTPHPHPADDSRDMSPPEPASPTVGLDKKTRRKFLDLG